MRGTIVNTALAAAAALTMLGHELGVLAPADAFFAAAAAVILYTGYQFAKRDGMPLGEAVADIVARPPARARGRAFHFVYLMSVVLGLVVMAQTLTRV